MPAKRPKPEMPSILPRSTAAQIGDILKLPRTTVRDSLLQATCGKDRKYDTVDALRVIYAHIQAKAGRSLNTEARNRQQMADAETAEIKAATARNELMLRADCMAIWRDGLIKTIQAIKSASYIPPQQRDRLVKSLREIEVDEPE